MLIHSISMHDFRQFKGTQTLSFSCDKEKNVTVLLGDNTFGKTTILQAFNWCLYGIAVFPKESNPDFLLNLETASENAGLNKKCEVVVTIVLSHKNIEYTIERIRVYVDRSYTSMRDYLYDEMIFDGEVFRYDSLDQRLVHLSAFQSCLTKEQSELRLFEIAPKEYVKDTYLFGQCNITKEEILEFQKQVEPLCCERYFNAHSIWNQIKDFPFVKTVGSNEWLCNSIIHHIDGIFALPIASNFILSFSTEELSIPFVCKWIAEKNGKTSLVDITAKFNSTFGTALNKNVIAEKLRSSGQWGQVITDEIDSYIDSLAVDDMDVDSLLEEDFF